MDDLRDLRGFELGAPPDEEGDVCRVCRVEGDEEMPLIYPCKCSGSVRFVHPDCLNNWLAHSQKKHCEICGHRYTFTKVYADYLPRHVPVTVYLRQLSRYLFRLIVKVSRFYAASNAWLVFLPAMNMFSLRSLLWLVDLSTPGKGGIFEILQTPSVAENITSTSNASNATTVISNITSMTVDDLLTRPLGSLSVLLHRSWTRWYEGEENTLFGFIFRGQALSIVLAGVIIGLILIREWMAQHNWNEHLPRHREHEPIRPEEWIIVRGVALNINEMTGTRKRAAKELSKRMAAGPDPSKAVTESQSKRKSQTDKHDRNMPDDGESEGPVGWQDEGDLPQPSSLPEVPVNSLHMALAPPPLFTPPPGSRTPSSMGDTDDGANTPTEENDQPVAGPSTIPQDEETDWPSPPPRPCTIDREVDLSFIAPELLEDRKGKGKETERSASTLDEMEAGPSNRGSDRVDPSGSPHPHTRPLPVLSVPTSPEDIAAVLPETAPDTLLDRLLPDEEGIGVVGQDSHVEPDNLWEDVDSTNSEDGGTDTQIGRDQPDDGPSPGLPEAAGEVNVEARDDGLDLTALQALMAPQDPNARDAVIALPGPPVPEAPNEIQLGEPIPLLEQEDVVFEVEDWDGILEVMGLIGPIQNLFQNVAFGIIIMSASMALLVGIPMWVGKLFLAIDFVHSITYTFDLVIRGSRLVLDPVTDVVWEILKEVVLLPLWSSFKALETILATKIGLGSAPISPSFGTSGDASRMSTIKVLDKPADFFAAIGQYTYNTYAAHRSAAKALGSSTSISGRLWTMLVGYGVIAVSLGLVAIAGEANIGRVSLSVSETIKQHALFVKLAGFMFIELAVFPLVIGLAIWVFTLPLLGEPDLGQLVAGWSASPAGTVFLGWLVGTMFMFGFASLLSQIRKLCRPGTLFFIRDPTEHSYNPVKDIIERPTVSQMRKIGVSAIMYTIVVACLFGVACWGLTLWPFPNAKLLPLRFNKLPPLSSVPFDLLFLHLVVPPSIEALRPRHRMKRALHAWWHATAKAFNLTSLLHGKTARFKTESRLTISTWRVADFFGQLVFGKYDTTESDARVPSSDQVVLLPPAERKGNGVFVMLDKLGAPKTADDKLRLLKQDRAAREGGRDPRADYRIVWLPRFWRTRVHALIFAALGTASAVIALAFFVPLVVGRLASSLFIEEEVHDGYSWLAGAYTCWGAYTLGRSVQSRIRILTRAERLRRSDSSTRFKRCVISFLSGLYALVMLYGILPALAGLVWELYVAVPGRYGTREGVAVVHFWDAWSMGVVFTSLFVGMADSLVRHDRPIAPRVAAMHEHLLKPFSVSFHQLNGTLLPVLLYLLLPIVMPLVLPVAWNAACGWLAPGYLINGTIFRLNFPFCLLAFFPVLFRRAFFKRLARLRQKIIDAEYVVEERVENYDAKTDRSNGGSEQTVKTAALDGGGGGSDAQEEGTDGGEVWEDVEDEDVFRRGMYT